MASSGAMVRAYVESLVEQIAGVEKAVSDDDGDFPVRVGNALFYVSVIDGDEPTVQVYSIAVREVPETADLLEKMNEINAQLRFCRAFFIDGRVVIATDCVCLTLDEAEFVAATQAVAGATEHFGPEIVAKFGGHLAFEDEPGDEEKAEDDGHVGQYL